MTVNFCDYVIYATLYELECLVSDISNESLSNEDLIDKVVTGNFTSVFIRIKCVVHLKSLTEAALHKLEVSIVGNQTGFFYEGW